MTAADGWTISDAFEQFDAAGMPVDRAGFRAVVRAARRTGRLKPLGETKSGDRGGRGQILYDIGELQRLHSALAPWLTRGATYTSTDTPVRIELSGRPADSPPGR